MRFEKVTIKKVLFPNAFTERADAIKRTVKKVFVDTAITEKQEKTSVLPPSSFAFETVRRVFF